MYEDFAAGRTLAEKRRQLGAPLVKMKRCDRPHRVSVDHAEKTIASLERHQREAAAGMTSERASLINS